MRNVGRINCTLGLSSSCLVVDGVLCLADFVVSPRRETAGSEMGFRDDAKGAIVAVIVVLGIIVPLKKYFVDYSHVAKLPRHF